MKNIEKLLRSGNIKPTRPLPHDFTIKTMQAIRDNSNKPGRLAIWKERIYMNLIHKPAMALAAFAAVAVISGTAYATIANWPQISSVFSGEKRLNSGNRIVGVDGENCNFFAAQNGLPKSSSKETVYYEIKKGSTLSNDQIVSMVRGICEENRLGNQVSAIIKPLIENDKAHDGFEGGTTYQIENISTSGITMKLDNKYGHNEIRQTFKHIAPDAKTYNQDQPAKLSDLKPGDTVTIITRNTTKGTNMETVDPERKNPDLRTIVAFIKHPPFSGSVDMFNKHLGTEIVRTEKCTTHPSGFCRAYEFQD
jgi:hypothetical protein